MEIVRDGAEREVVRFETDSGVTAVVATNIARRALRAFARGLRRRIGRR